MFDNEVIGARYGVVFGIVGLLFAVLSPVALIGGLVYLYKKRKDRGLKLLVGAPLLFALAYLMIQAGCIRRTVVVDLSSPQNSFRARTVVRNSGGMGSLMRTVEVAKPGFVGWKWNNVLTTSAVGVIELAWEDDMTLVVKGRLDTVPVLSAVEGVRVRYEACGPATGPAPALFVNHC